MLKSQWIQTISDVLYICLVNPSKRKDRKGEWSFEVLDQNLHKVGFEVVKCDKHSSLYTILFALVQSPARQNGLPFPLWHRQLELL